MDGTHPQTHTQTDTEIGEGKTSREKRCHRQQRQRCHISTFQHCCKCVSACRLFRLDWTKLAGVEEVVFLQFAIYVVVVNG
jgi:hypothetical protein